VRWLLSLAFANSRTGTFIANLLGVALAGFLLVFLERHGNDFYRHLLLPGFCGGLTTFSALAFMTLHPNEGGAAYFLLTLICSLLIVAIVISLSRKFIPVRK